MHPGRTDERNRQSTNSHPHLLLAEAHVYLQDFGLQATRARRELVKGRGHVGRLHGSQRAAERLHGLDEALHVQRQLHLHRRQDRGGGSASSSQSDFFMKSLIVRIQFKLRPFTVMNSNLINVNTRRSAAPHVCVCVCVRHL